MTIEKNVNGTELNIKVIGRLDTTTAPVLEQTICKETDGTQHLILDLKDMPYISSAGLRVLLTARKSIQGDLILNNVTPSVQDVLEITGFVDILTIE